MRAQDKATQGEQPLDSFAPDPDKLLVYRLYKHTPKPYTHEQLMSEPYRQRDVVMPKERKWWRRYGESDWRWSDESWQTEASKSRRTPPQGR